MEGLLEASKLGWRPASHTVFNPHHIGPHRRFDWTELGNHVAMIMAELPLGERDPAARLQRVIETTRKLKHSKQWLGVSWLEGLANRIGGRFFVELSLSATRNRPFNVVVANVPGPKVPLFPNQALAVAVLSYDGKMFWGFNSAWDVLPDVHDLVDGVRVQFGELHAAARATRPGPKGSTGAPVRAS